MSDTDSYGIEVGIFQHEWNNPPAPFNPEFDPRAAGRHAQVISSLESDNFYADHTRTECAVEYRARYDALRG